MAIEIDMRLDLHASAAAIDQAKADREQKLQSFKDWIEEQLLKSGVVMLDKDYAEGWLIRWKN